MTSPPIEPTKNTQHTPGPWTITEGHRNRIIYGAEGDAIAEVHWWVMEHAAESAANARLIAAAPDYDAAARMLLKWFDGSGSSMRARWERIPPEEALAIVNAFRAALAKAESR